jgi:hypothetical protein
MVKETKFFRKQAKKAERMARAISDAEAAESLSNLAEAYRKQADGPAGIVLEKATPQLRTSGQRVHALIGRLVDLCFGRIHQ